MSFNSYKLKHYYFNKYIFSFIKKRKYYLSYDYAHKALWYRTYKVASRTIDDKLKAEAGDKKYIYAPQKMGYSPKMFKNFFKFAFVRHPEDRFISAWKDKVLRQNYFNFSELEYEKMKNLDQFLGWVEGLDIDTCDGHLRSQNSLIDLNNLDFLGRFESFTDDFKYVLEQLGIQHDNIKHRNKGPKVEVDLKAEQRIRIYNIYKKDFSFFYPAHREIIKNLQNQKYNLP